MNLLFHFAGGSLTYAKASYKSVYGEIQALGEKEGKTVSTVTVPGLPCVQWEIASGKEYIQTTGTWEYGNDMSKIKKLFRMTLRTK